MQHKHLRGLKILARCEGAQALFPASLAGGLGWPRNRAIYLGMDLASLQFAIQILARLLLARAPRNAACIVQLQRA